MDFPWYGVPWPEGDVDDLIFSAMEEMGASDR